MLCCVKHNLFTILCIVYHVLNVITSLVSFIFQSVYKKTTHIVKAKNQCFTRFFVPHFLYKICILWRFPKKNRRDIIRVSQAGRRLRFKEGGKKQADFPKIQNRVRLKAWKGANPEHKVFFENCIV